MKRAPLVLSLLLCASVLSSVSRLVAQSASTQTAVPPWLAAAWHQALTSPLLPSIRIGKTPAVLPETTTMLDANGATTTYFPGGDVTTANNAFFKSLGTNGRTCLTCHQPQNDWSISPGTILTTYAATSGQDPLFAPVDGADCPTTGAANSKAGVKFIAVRSQLFNHGNFRISLPQPATHDWISVSVVKDPTGCEKDPAYGLPSGSLSFYRRPLPATNVIYTTPGVLPAIPNPEPANIMWDTREPSLASQFKDATLTHAQAAAAPTDDQANQGVAFQSGSFTAQTRDLVAGDLTGADSSDALGGPVNLYAYSNSVPYSPIPFADLGGGLCGQNVLPCPGSVLPEPLVPGDFDGSQVYGTFENATGPNPAAAARRKSIARGETIFNTRTFPITGVSGLNDVPGFGPTDGSPVVGTCGRCHNNVNVGNDAFDDPKHLGIADNTGKIPVQSPLGSTTLPLTTDQPVFSFLCPVGSIPYFSNPVTYQGQPYDQYLTSDPGVGWVSGKCADLGKFKVSTLRGIGARPPFFHNGQAATMRDVVLFYNVRFNIGLNNQDIQDLVNYLNAL